MITEIRAMQFDDPSAWGSAVFTTCATFGKPAIKKLRNSLIDREYSRDQRLCRGPDYRR
jgi:hypothetical protein